MSRSEGLNTEVQWLKGAGPKVAMHLKRLGLETVRDVLFYLPRRFEDRRNLPPIMLARPGFHATVRGRLERIFTKSLRGGKVLLTARIVDDTGVMNLIWFNQPWVRRELEKVNGEIIAYGMVKEGSKGLEMTSPEWEFIADDDDPEDFARIVPVYPLKEGVPQWAVRKASQAAVEYFASMAEDRLPEWLRKREGFPSIQWTLTNIHYPEDQEKQERARSRLAFEELLALQLWLQMRRREVQQEVGIAFAFRDAEHNQIGGTLFASDVEAETIDQQMLRMLPFDLTRAQKRVIEEIWHDMEQSIPMNRLVQGDVGSGKTAVAAAAMLAAVRGGYQAALMAPTEILAEQHAINLRRMFEPLGIGVELLVGKLNAQQRKKALQKAASGEAAICVGTHALIQEGVSFSKLGLAVIDEQHRFGVLQRAAIRQKGLGNPDVLVMTATPIPRTLTMTLYGDLDVSVIDEMPPGRKPIKTHWKKPEERESVYGIVKKLVEEGRQAYFVCPMISESEKMQTQAAEDLHYRLTNEIYPNLKVGLLHGQMKPLEKEGVMEQFRRHELDILVSTVVIEVGVDVPNASVMVIEDAFRFGLSQLHQLRGRVGRGEHQSFCILISDARTPEAEQRLSIMRETTDGFKIAEADLEIRGPGDVAGTRQAGAMNLRVADLVRDLRLLETAKQCAIDILDRDPELKAQEMQGLIDLMRQQNSQEALATIS